MVSYTTICQGCGEPVTDCECPEGPLTDMSDNECPLCGGRLLANELLNIVTDKDLSLKAKLATVEALLGRHVV